MIANRCGRADVVLHVESASKLIHELHDKQREEPEDEESLIMELAGRICASRCRETSYSTDTYFKLEELTPSTMFSLLPKPLQIFLSALQSPRSRVDDTLAHAAIGQR